MHDDACRSRSTARDQVSHSCANIGEGLRVHRHRQGIRTATFSSLHRRLVTSLLSSIKVQGQNKPPGPGSESPGLRPPRAAASALYCAVPPHAAPRLSPAARVALSPPDAPGPWCSFSQAAHRLSQAAHRLSQAAHRSVLVQRPAEKPQVQRPSLRVGRRRAGSTGAQPASADFSSRASVTCCLLGLVGHMLLAGPTRCFESGRDGRSGAGLPGRGGCRIGAGR